MWPLTLETVDLGVMSESVSLNIFLFVGPREGPRRKLRQDLYKQLKGKYWKYFAMIKIRIKHFRCMVKNNYYYIQNGKITNIERRINEENT